MELIASKNYLLPRLDAVGRYRWRGFGDDLFPVDPKPAPPDGQFDNAYGNLTSGAFQEWQLGFELNVPIGFREAHVATRNAELLLARERAILRDQQREIVHEAADAISEMDRAYAVLQTSYNRLAANRDQLGAVQAAYENDKVPLDLFLDAQRRVADAETDYHLNRSRYSLATKNVHFVKGTLLEYDGVLPGRRPVAVRGVRRRGRARSLARQPEAAELCVVAGAGCERRRFDQNAGRPVTMESSDGPAMQTPTQPETLPPPSDVQPLPAPANGAALPNGSGAMPSSSSRNRLHEPRRRNQRKEALSSRRGRLHPTPSASHCRKSDCGPALSSNRHAQETATPAVPQRLPPTSQPQ